MRLKDVRNLFRLKKEIDDTKFKDIRNLSRLKREMKHFKLEILRTFFNMKKKIVINQQDEVIFGVIII